MACAPLHLVEPNRNKVCVFPQIQTLKCSFITNFLLMELFSTLLNIYYVVTSLQHRFTFDPAALMLFLVENVAEDSDYLFDVGLI